MLISPTEPLPIRKLGKTSSSPEKFGADILLTSHSFGSVGIQRKEISDLIASVHDGRLTKELMQMKALGLGLLLIEGRLQWTNDGALVSTSSWTRAQHLGVLWSVQSRGYWIATSSDMMESCAFILTFQTWLAKSRHNSLTTRPKATSAWGYVDDRDWAIHLLQSFTGIGAETAGRIYDHFGGVPIQWTVTEQDMQQIPGIGQTKAERLIQALSMSRRPVNPPTRSPKPS